MRRYLVLDVQQRLQLPIHGATDVVRGEYLQREHPRRRERQLPRSRERSCDRDHFRRLLWVEIHIINARIVDTPHKLMGKYSLSGASGCEKGFVKCFL